MEFSFNTIKARQSIILFIVSSVFLVFLLALTDNKLSLWLSEFLEIYVALLLVYIFFIFVLIKRLYSSFKYEPKIIFTLNELHVPTYYLGIKKILIKDIYSVENLIIKNKLIGVYLGVKNQTSYILEKDRFKNYQEFRQVYDYINQNVNEINSIQDNLIIKEVSYKQQNNYAIFTYCASVLAVIFYFIGTQGGVEYTNDIDFLVLGANTKDTIASFELYRVASSTFLHISIFHLLLNLLVLGIFSQFLEKVLAYVRFTNIFLFSSAVAVLMSAGFSDFDASIGASGGIFGLWGAYAYLKFNYENYLPGSINSIPTRKFYVVLLFEVIAEIFFLDNVDYINHLGGFLAGFLYIFLAPLGPKLEKVDKPVILEKVLFYTLVSAYSLGLMYFLAMYYSLP